MPADWKSDRYIKWCLRTYMRHCKIQVIKLCQVRIKLIALGWYWVTIIFWCQINPKIHCSPAMHKVQVITKYLSYKSMKASWKWTIFGSFMVQLLWITCFVVIFLSKINCMPILCIHFWICLQFSYTILQAIYDMCKYFTG